MATKKPGALRRQRRIRTALKKAAATYKFNTYPGTMHAFHNDTGQRYNAEQSRRAWVDAIEWLRKYLM